MPDSYVAPLLLIHRAQTHTQYAPVVLHGIVARVEEANAGDLDHEHGGAQHVARVVAPELDPLVFHALCGLVGKGLG